MWSEWLSECSQTHHSPSWDSFLVLFVLRTLTQVPIWPTRTTVGVPQVTTSILSWGLCKCWSSARSTLYPLLSQLIPTGSPGLRASGGLNNDPDSIQVPIPGTWECILDGKCDFLKGCDHICIPLEASLSSHCPMLSSFTLTFRSLMNLCEGETLYRYW